MFLTPNSMSNTNSQKILIECEKQTFFTEKSLKSMTDFDKSRVLLTYMNKNEKLIAKIGDNLSNLKQEYEIGQRLEKLRGYIRFLCFFTCTDDFMRHPNSSNKKLCDSTKNKTMDVIIMPYYELGSLGDFSWSNENIVELQLCIKQLLLYSIVNFERYGLIHGDLHAKNILLKKTDNNYPLKYKVGNKTFTIRRSMYDIVIMDFENSMFDKQDINAFYIDFNKFFILLSSFIKHINKNVLQQCNVLIGKYALQLSTNFDELLTELLQLVDNIEITT
jgi:hypothetical protein